ncbi:MULTISPECIES: RluA family pseudouridine synthase [Tenacibaculum]|uniref:RluA family pseudouridine synthase n=1 Tax=Tenacibaculum TaxID=104267 RepID=UPI001F0B0A51|nr:MULTISPECIES: RluA family pseudouridine synthase [Tenacibaculum]MCH3883281.1 RluA family pseudouridine synthase [Tenacibaculum aquimarinum]MDO6600363.1 RluA family pseudouridine synthase [Tenacibaculum sp. 1_MG-2023]
MQLIESHKVPALEKSIRLQDYGVGIFSTNPTKSGLKKAIKKGLVFVDGKIATTALYIIGNETIEFFQSEENRKEFDFDLKVLFEDDFLAVIYKPAGILVSGNSFATIDNALFQNIKKSTQTDAVKPRPVHRLDYPTSGLLLIGKTNSSIIALNKLFENKEIQKKYHAISIGKMETQGTIKLPIDDKKSLTHFKVLKTVTSERFGFLNLVKLSPKTGRKHQLRKHLASLGNPILGDKEYYLDNLILNGKGLYLHASTLEFVHPFTKENIRVSENLPKKFKKIFPH